jgi:transcriptional regulator of arginine metabolism
MHMRTDERILQLLEKHEITDQAHLQSLLARHGHDLTQPTLSRHLKKLHVRKVEGRYSRVEPGAAEFGETELRLAPPNLIILKTAPGFAPALAYALDEKVPKDLVAGTVAGEDTVIVAVADPSKLNAAAAALKHALKLS